MVETRVLGCWGQPISSLEKAVFSNISIIIRPFRLCHLQGTLKNVAIKN